MTEIQMTISDPLLVVIAGPTAVGKTAFGIQVARRLNTQIISADSRQFYREMKIGTAVPSQEELNIVPHHFIHQLSVHDTYNVSRFESEVIPLLETLFRKHPVILMVGGSGLYINAVCHGIDQLPDPDPEIRRELKQNLKTSGIQALQDELRQADQEYYNMVDLANPARLIRALEVYRSTGVPYSALRSHTPKSRPFRILKIGIDLPREVLNKRINSRVDEMMREGLAEEARRLYPLRHLNAMNTVGYKELFDYFEGLTSLEFAVEKIKTSSRRYAKRQLTWFRKDKEYRWFQPDDVEQVINSIQVS